MKFKNMAVCDLRGYNSVEAASEIESISGVALVILPKDADAQTRAAFAKVEMQNVASTIYCDADAKINIYNGKLTLSDANVFDGENVYVINGKACILPISPQKKVSLIVNGKAVYDKNSENIELLTVNGKAVPLDLQDAEGLENDAFLPAEKFAGDGKNKYYAADLAVVAAVPKTAHGKVLSERICADVSVRESGVHLEAETVIYATVGEETLIKADLPEFYLTQTLLESLTGNLILKDIGTVRIDKKVTPELLREKVLLLCDIGAVRATKTTFDTVQLLCQDVGSITRK